MKVQILLCVCLLWVYGCTQDPPHATPRTTFDANADSGMYLSATKEVTLACNGQRWKKISELTREELLALFGSGRIDPDALQDLCAR